MNPTPEHRAALAASLHNLADFIATSQVPVPYGGVTLHVFEGSIADDHGVMHSIDSQMGMAVLAGHLGRCEKHADSSYFRLIKKFGPHADIHFLASRQEVCERVKVGTKVIPAEEEKVIPAKPSREEDVFEWRCPSLLKAGASVEMPSDPPAIEAPQVLALAAPADDDFPPF